MQWSASASDLEDDTASFPDEGSADILGMALAMFYLHYLEKNDYFNLLFEMTVW